MPKHLRLALNVGLVILALVVIAWSGVASPAALVGVFANPVVALIALAVILAGAQLSVIRWHLLLAWQGSPMRYGQAWRISYISWFLGTILPGAAGADALRALYVHRDSTARALAFVSIVLDRLLGLIALLVLSIGLLALSSLNHRTTGLLGVGMWVFLGGSLVVVAVAPFVVVVLNSTLLKWATLFPRIRNIVRELDDAAKLALAVWHRQPLKLLFCLGLGIAGHIFVVASVLILANGAGITSPPPLELALAAALAVLINQLPLTPGGIGVGELGFAQLCLLMAPGSDASQYGSVLLAFRLITLVSYAPGAIALVGHRPAAKTRSIASNTESASESSRPG